MPQNDQINELQRQLQQLQAEIAGMRDTSALAEAGRLKLAESEGFYRTLVELAADTILMGDHAGNIVEANRSATILTGYTHDELLGQSISVFFSEAERQRAPLRYDLLKKGDVVQTERDLTRKDGTTVPVSMNSKMMPDGTYHSLIRDITLQKRLEAKLQASNLELESFVATVSHDLRTPLTPIIGFSEMLAKDYSEVLDEDGLQLLEQIENAGNSMLALLDDLLLYASIGKLERPEFPVSTQQVVDEVIRNLDREIAATGVSVQVDSLPSLHIPKTFLTQIFNNLISNSLRYAGAKNRIIKVWSVQNGERVQFFVRDHGQGIAEQEQAVVFDAFYRGISVFSSEGSGLGLSIVQKIAHNYGGDARVVESGGVGCTILVEMVDSAKV